jgi:hypothetical protein
MEIGISKNGIIELTKVYNSIELRTNTGEVMTICMRDSGFEFTYDGGLYRANKGILEKIEKVCRKIDTALPESPNHNNLKQ